MARRPNWRRVKQHHSYTVDEVSRLLGVAKITVRRWLKNGLLAMTGQKPLLILGGDLIDFLRAQRKSTTHKCRLDQCFCFRCRVPREAAFEEMELIHLTSTSGNVRALCGTCTQVMHKRVRLGRLDELRSLVTLTVPQGAEHISDIEKPCLTDHLPKEANPDA